MTKTSTDEDCIAIKFSEVSDESVDLSLKTTDEDDIRNTENTIECDGGKDIDRLLNGMKIHIKRNTALDLENLLKGLFKPYDMKDDKQEFDNSELSKTTEALKLVWLKMKMKMKMKMKRRLRRFKMP
ncbi:unnamed protein product [Rhizophagus irregularis]|nr:unnamed protein product [Rhizophagus irregularis]